MGFEKGAEGQKDKYDAYFPNYIQNASESRVQTIAPLSSNFALIFSTSEAGPTTLILMPFSPTTFMGSGRSSLISSRCFITLSTLVYPSLQKTLFPETANP